ncbi:biotin transporter BioY [Agaricicola taiwanensis]|uniref:Biotin transporter n=1 Tax=Agaricicola taiwanensis TaxID=591372 RepID=A0A8J2YIU5_9RHOB|nr:biotin transporter BioY [Agaricicola taiwanensis]GGE46482.1 biotin transporter BioY [Agaricicola taiwanensis]
MAYIESSTPASTPLATLAGNSIARRIAIIALGSLVIAAAARINVPMYPVPMSLQTLAIIVIAALSGFRLSSEILGAYLIQGIIGLPVFATGAGFAYFMGPTGGYLVGFFLGAIAIGYLADRGWNNSLPKLAASLTLGHALVFVPGVAWLAVLIGWEKALVSGLAVFIVGSIVKTLLGVAMVKAALRGRSAAPTI